MASRQSGENAIKRPLAWLLALAALVPLIATPVTGASPRTRGHAIAQAQCARCHAIEREGESPLALAPPFRVLPQRYPVEQLAEALAEGIATGHPAMPEFTFEPDDIDALLTYMATLNGAGKVPGGKR